MDATRGIVYKAPAATGAIELTWSMAVVTRAVEITLPVAIVAAAYIVGQAIVDTWDKWGAVEEKENGGVAIYGSPPVLFWGCYIKLKGC